ncbi:CP3AL-like protein [Mya arenaria]|uniref:CP3AL-like protein n=1 Tax=Mya arenaria TaxID=6604 RepID=A0ABY7DCY2_MYAAR|nr:CP3AL-like protein [Mya arenaria]
MDILGLFDLPRWAAAFVFFLTTVCLYTWYKQSYFKRMGIRQRKTMFFLGDIIEIAKKGLGYLDIDDYKTYGKVFGVVRGYTIDVTCSTGFGTEVSAQTDPNNPFNRHAKVALTFKPATSPMFLMYGLTDTEVIANSIMFMLAGFDTTASSIAWVLYDLALNPDVQEKLIEAIDEEIGENKLSYDNVFNMRYMDMVMSETLRIHPPAQRLNREASEDIEIKGLKIQKGMDCTYCPTILHFVEEYWDEPNKFNPERYRCPLRRHLAASTNLRSPFTCDWKEGSDVNPEISNMMKKRRAE